MQFTRTLVSLGAAATFGFCGSSFAGSPKEEIDAAIVVHRARALEFMASIQAQQKDICPYSDHEIACAIEYRLATWLVFDMRLAADLMVIAKTTGDLGSAEKFDADRNKLYEDLVARVETLRQIHVVRHISQLLR